MLIHSEEAPARDKTRLDTSDFASGLYACAPHVKGLFCAHRKEIKYADSQSIGAQGTKHPCS